MAIDREAQLLAAATAAGMTRPRELANFMAQVSHESNGLNRLEESFRYTRNISQIPAQSAWRDGTNALETARVGALRGNPEKLAELMYGGQKGNEHPGDGYLYRGRGYLPLTGKDNYRAAGEALDLDLVKRPELAAEPGHAARIAVWYWQSRVPEMAREDVKAATHAVNGKYHGLDDRRERFASWESRLSPQVMERLTKAHRHPVPEIKEESAAERDTINAIEHAQDLIEAGRRHGHRPHGPGHPPAPAYPLNHASHPDHALFRQAQHAVHRLDAEHRREPDTRSDNLAAALTVAARHQGMHRIDHVALSADATHTYAVQGDIHSPHKQVAEVHTQQAIATPVEQSTQDLARHAAQATEHAQQQNQNQQASHHASQPTVPL
jgi:putative chitinase